MAGQKHTQFKNGAGLVTLLTMRVILLPQLKYLTFVRFGLICRLLLVHLHKQLLTPTFPDGLRLMRVLSLRVLM